MNRVQSRVPHGKKLHTGFYKSRNARVWGQQ